MFCPTCQAQNDAIATHCFQCRTQLVFDEKGRSPELKATMRNLDYRIYGGVGCLVFAVLGFVMFRSAVPSIIFGLVGGALGRYIASRRTRGL